MSAPPARRSGHAVEFDGKPYIWGGGHASFTAKGYDCSGAVSYALHGADLLGYTQVSGQLAHYGYPSVGLARRAGRPRVKKFLPCRSNGLGCEPHASAVPSSRSLPGTAPNYRGV
jgi:hypothetical protein